MGLRVPVYTDKANTSSAGSFSIGGFGKQGDGGQGGAAASGQLTQLVMRVHVRECVFAIAQAAPVVVVPAQVLPVPARADRN